MFITSQTVGTTTESVIVLGESGNEGGNVRRNVEFGNDEKLSVLGIQLGSTRRLILWI